MPIRPTRRELVNEGDRHQAGTDCEEDRKPVRQIERVGVDLLRGADEAEQRTENAGGCQRVAECDAVGENEGEAPW